MTDVQDHEKNKLYRGFSPDLFDVAGDFLLSECFRRNSATASGDTGSSRDQSFCSILCRNRFDFLWIQVLDRKEQVIPSLYFCLIN